MAGKALGNQNKRYRDSLDTEADRARHWRRIGATHQLSVASRDQSVSLMLTDFPAYEGEFSYSNRLNIYMGVRGSGRIMRRSDAQLFDAILHPGRVGFAVPGTAGEGLWDEVTLLFLSAELSRIPISGSAMPRGEDFVPVASAPQDDPLLTSVLTAMWRDAEAHGVVSAFFEHGLLLVANRLLSLKVPPASETRPLDRERLKRVTDWIEASLADDLSVAELAKIAGMSRPHFSRAFKAATGTAPFEYLTIRRMERAKTLLEHEKATIVQVALEVGYSNPSQFAAAFRRITGYAPSRWRARRH